MTRSPEQILADLERDGILTVIDTTTTTEADASTTTKEHDVHRQAV